MRKKRKATRFNCFSPPVMLATLTIESFLSVYTLWRYRMTALTRLIAGIFVTLAVFQLSEYYVCTGVVGNVSTWSRLGFAAITALPVLGVHLLHIVAGKPRRRLVGGAYVSMAAFVGFFLLYQEAFFGHQCTGNYVIFQIAYTYGGLFTAYYFSWLFISLLMGMHWANQLREKGKISRKRLESVRAVIVGYLIFLVPTALANTVRPETRRGIPSVMCGFAVLFALILGLYILPRLADVKREISLKLPQLLKP